MKRRSTRSSSRASSSTSSPRAAIPSRACSSSGISSGTPPSSTGFRLKPVPSGQEYQLWFIKDGKPVPSVTFKPESDRPCAASRRFRCRPVERSALRRSRSSPKEALNSRRRPRCWWERCRSPDRATRAAPPRVLRCPCLAYARAFLLLATITAPLRAQSEDAVAQERTAFAEWLADRPCVSARRSRSAADRGRPDAGSRRQRTYRSRALHEHRYQSRRTDALH